VTFRPLGQHSSTCPPPHPQWIHVYRIHPSTGSVRYLHVISGGAALSLFREAFLIAWLRDVVIPPNTRETNEADRFASSRKNIIKMLLTRVHKEIAVTSDNQISRVYARGTRDHGGFRSTASLRPPPGGRSLYRRTISSDSLNGDQTGD